MKINITIKGDKEALARLDKRLQGLKDFSKELNEVGRYLVNFHKVDVFESEGQVIGEKWPLLSPNYEYRKRNEFPGRGILEQTGALRKGFKYIAGPKRMVFRNTVKKYGPTHQFGDEKRGIPQRMFFKVDKQRQKKIVAIIAQGLQERIARA